MLLVCYIQRFFFFFFFFLLLFFCCCMFYWINKITSITVLTNEVWKLLIVLFKVPDTGAFTVPYERKIYFIIHRQQCCDLLFIYFFGERFRIRSRGFLAHLSRRLKWAIAVRFRPSSVNFLHFHLLLENAWLDFNQTWQESSLGVGDSKLFKSYVWPPWGPRGRAPKGENHANFKHLLLQIQKENGQVM